MLLKLPNVIGNDRDIKAGVKSPVNGYATAVIRLRDYPRSRGAGFLVLNDAKHRGEGVWLADCDLEAGPAGIQAACGQIRQRLAELSPGILDGTTPWEPADMQPWAAQRLRQSLAGGS